MVLIIPLMSSCLNLLCRHLRIVSSAPAITAITDTFMIHVFSSLWQGLCICLFFCSLLQSVACWNDKIHMMTYYFLHVNVLGLVFLIITKSGPLVRTGWYICIPKTLRILSVTFSWSDSGLCIYHLSASSNFHLVQFPVNFFSLLIIFLY